MVTRVTAPSAGKKPARTLPKKAPQTHAYRQALPDERMSKVDTAFLRMDNDANLMQITGVWQLAPGVT
jgi:diacylglycerol O-acyltransferase